MLTLNLPYGNLKCSARCEIDTTIPSDPAEQCGFLNGDRQAAPGLSRGGEQQPVTAPHVLCGHPARISGVHAWLSRALDPMSLGQVDAEATLCGPPPAPESLDAPT